MMTLFYIYIFPVICTSISSVLYVYYTNFGKLEKSELDKLNYENEILKKQIEQKELKDRL